MSALTTDTSLKSRIAQAYERSELDSSITCDIYEAPATKYKLHDLCFQYADTHDAMDQADVILLPCTDASEPTNAAVTKGLSDLFAERVSKLVLFVPDQQSSTYTMLRQALGQALTQPQISDLMTNELVIFSSFKSFADDPHHRADIVVANAQSLNRLELKTLFNMTGIGSRIALCGVDNGQENGFAYARALIRNQEVGRPSIEFSPARNPA